MTLEDRQWLEELLKLMDDEQKMTKKQSKIIEAAIEVFSEKGYHGSSTSEIAKLAGVAEGTIFRHYRTKKDLLMSIVAPMITSLVGPLVLRDFNKLLSSPFVSFEQFLRAIVHERWNFVKKYHPVFKVLVQEIPFHPELKDQYIHVIAEKTIGRVKLVVERFQEEGQIIQLPSPTILRLAISSILGFFIARYILFPAGDWDEEAEMEHTVQFLLRGFSYQPSQGSSHT